MKRIKMTRQPQFFGVLFILQLCLTHFSIATTNLCEKAEPPVFKVAVSVNSFLGLVQESTLFIDKTLLIKDFLDDKNPVVFLTCPSGWGKSINMDMIRLFLQIEVDANGAEFAKEKTVAYKTFIRGENKYGNISKLLIAQHQDLVNTHMAQHPVVYINFDEVTGTRFHEIFNQIRKIVAETYAQHLYAYDYLKKRQEAKSNDQLDNLIEDFEKTYSKKVVSKMELQSSLLTLCEILSLFHGNKKVFVFIDGYDRPVTLSLSKIDGSNIADLKETIRFLWAMLSITFKNNIHLNRGFVSGVDRVNLASFMTELSNMTDYNVFKNPFYKYYGFTNDEFNLLFNKIGVTGKLVEDSRKWVGGYRTCEDEKARIYDTISVVSIVNHRDFKISKPHNILLDKFLSKIYQFKEIRPMIFRLLNGETIEAEIDNLKIEEDEYLNLHKILHKGLDHKEGPMLISRLLFRSGYLTLAGEDKTWRSGGVKKGLISYYNVTIPNRQILSDISCHLLKSIEKERDFKAEITAALEKTLKYLFNSQCNDTEPLRRSLHAYLQLLIPYPVESKNTTKSKSVESDWSLTAVNSVILHASQVQPIDSFFRLEMPVGKSEKQHYKDAHVILTEEESNVGLIIGVEHGVSADEALSRAEQHVEFFKNHPLIKQIRVVGIILVEGNVDVKDKWIKK